MGFRVNSAGRVRQSHFAQVPNHISAPRSAFDRSFPHKTTMSEGVLVPVFWEPVLPGDTVSLSMNVLARLATPIFPYMDNVEAIAEWFYVPNRLLWTNWERFQGAQDDPSDSTEFEVPSLDDATHAAGFAELSIYDYFDLPTKVANVPQARMPIALPLRAYNKIWNEWYRDQNYQDSVPVDLSNGPDTTAYTLLKRNRRKDYFTSALPEPQKGPEVLLPVGSTAPVISTGDQIEISYSGLPSEPVYVQNASPKALVLGGTPPGSPGNATFGAVTGLEADLSAAAGTTVNAWREAVVLQQMLELDARGGTRITELILARFGVTVPDFRVGRSEFLGSQVIDVNVNPIAQSSSTDAETPQGNLSAFAVGRGKSFINHSFPEHGQLLCLLSFRADTTYQQGLSRHWSVRTRFDYYEPLAANLGEQAILNKELLLQGTSEDEEVAGYNERWAEYRYKNGYVTGRMRSNSTVPLDTWHLALDFDGILPAIEDILPENPPISRIVAVASEPHFIVDMWTRFRHVRIMPVYSAPGLSRL